jgi:hypothetical protein
LWFYDFIIYLNLPRNRCNSRPTFTPCGVQAGRHPWGARPERARNSLRLLHSCHFRSVPAQPCHFGIMRARRITESSRAARHQRHGRQLHEEGASRAHGRTGLALHPQSPAAAFEFRCSSRYAAVRSTSCKYTHTHTRTRTCFTWARNHTSSNTKPPFRCCRRSIYVGAIQGPAVKLAGALLLRPHFESCRTLRPANFNLKSMLVMLNCDFR